MSCELKGDRAWRHIGWIAPAEAGALIRLQPNRSTATIPRSLTLGAFASTLLCATAAAQTSVILPGPSGRAKAKFEIRVPPSVRNEPLTGRVYVVISGDSTREPRSQIGRVGTPLFGR